MRILVTGGTGYIGSHTVIELVNAGHNVVIVDNLSNSKQAVVDRLQQITQKSIPFFQLDLRHKLDLSAIFDKFQFDAVIHFAGLKAVGESVQNPLHYYDNNIGSTLVLCQLMAEFNIKNLVFSSSATVYGHPQAIPLTEETPLGPITNPYGHTKAMIEQILRDLHHADSTWNIALLRYFNPVGAHPSGLIGEDPNGIPNNLMPYITQVAIGKRPFLPVFGNDYPTPDGTGVRDYLHVVDLALGHLSALHKLTTQSGLVTYNLGTGTGYSVLDMIAAFSRACGCHIPYQIKPRRPGDLPVVYADVRKANHELNWQAQRSLDDMCADSWRWQQQNPDGLN
ncbi:MAG TPA: UDP-glucose 4-epimerase GalE [Anaerolineae bacterium]|nr:UDP-glucose 4-epimerase GalE [Anaerolineae bacterium]